MSVIRKPTGDNANLVNLIKLMDKYVKEGKCWNFFSVKYHLYQLSEDNFELLKDEYHAKRTKLITGELQ